MQAAKAMLKEPNGRPGVSLACAACLCRLSVPPVCAAIHAAIDVSLDRTLMFKTER